ncbi:MAG: DUF4097 family beta strand repeat-containing protein, partial [Rectinema sp.]
VNEDPAEDPPDSMRLGVPSDLGRLIVSTASGDMSVSDFDGELELTSASGGIETSGCSGRQRAKTLSGDIEIDGAEEEVHAETMSGSINVSIEDGDSGGRIVSVSGDIEVVLPEDADLRLKVSTVSGDISFDGKPVHSGEVRLGSGRGVLVLQTISGDIVVRRR